MATLPAFFRRETTAGTQAPSGRAAGGSAPRDPFQLRALPHEDVYFYCKKIDNSRLVREPDPRARGACWSAIGAACLVLALVTGVLAPNVACTLAGYRIEALRAEGQRLADERRDLELQEAELLSPQRLEVLAQGQNLVTPSPDQVVHLDNKTEGAVAMVKK